MAYGGRDISGAWAEEATEFMPGDLPKNDARIAELDSRLAKFTTANVPDTPSEPAHNPFQAFMDDPRRMGP